MISRIVLACSCTVLFLTAVCPQEPVQPKPEDKAVQSDLQAMQGTWRVIGFDSNDKESEIARKLLADATFQLTECKKVKVTMSNKKVWAWRNLELKPDKRPKHFDVEVFDEGDKRWEKMWGIYEVGKGQLQIAWSSVGLEDRRPDKFGPILPDGLSQFTVTLKRISEKKKN